MNVGELMSVDAELGNPFPAMADFCDPKASYLNLLRSCGGEAYLLLLDDLICDRDSLGGWYAFRNSNVSAFSDPDTLLTGGEELSRFLETL